MNVILFNASWMAWNIFLALLGMFFGLLLARPTYKVVKYLWTLLWLIFIPNTIYVVTDLYHLTYQINRVHANLQPFLVLQYFTLAICGVLTYLIGFASLEKMLLTSRFKKHTFSILIAMNFLISFGVTLGRFQRTNSWDIITYPQHVLVDIKDTVFSVELMAFT